MPTSLFLRHLFLVATVAALSLILVHMTKREQPTPAQLYTGGPKTFTEDFSTVLYRDINYSSAHWDTASGTLSIPANRTEAQALSLSVDAVSDTIEAATLAATFTSAQGQTRFYLSNDNGITYLPVVEGQELLFTTQGSKLKWKAELSRSEAGAAPVLDGISITYRTKVPDHVVQITSTDAIHLGIEASKVLFAEPSSASAVVLGRANDVIDTFAATPLARAKNAPLLFTESSSLHPDTLHEIQRALPDHSREIIIVGGSMAVSDQVINDLSRVGYRNIHRLGGPTRYETAGQIAEAILASNPTQAQHVYATEARFLADAYSASAPAAASADGIVEPIVLLERGGGGR